MHISAGPDIHWLWDHVPDTPNQHIITLCKQLFPYEEEVTEATLPTLIERIPERASQYFIDESKWWDIQQTLLQIAPSQELQAAVVAINDTIEELRRQLTSSFQHIHPMSTNTYVALKQMYGEQVGNIDYTIWKWGYACESFFWWSINDEQWNYADIEQDVYQLADRLSSDISRGNISDDLLREVESLADELKIWTNDTHRPVTSNFTSVKERIFSLMYETLRT